MTRTIRVGKRKRARAGGVRGHYHASQNRAYRIFVEPAGERMGGRNEDCSREQKKRSPLNRVT